MFNFKRKFYINLFILFLLMGLIRQRVFTQEYIKNLSDFPAYPYNSAAYKQGGTFVGCGPTTGAMIFGYFDHVYDLIANPLLTDAVTGTNEGLNTAWALHGSQYMKTESTGFGSVMYIKPGLENYANDRGQKVTVMIHASPTYTGPDDPNAGWLNDYGPYAVAWINDGYFWRDSGGNWWIDADDFCDFVGTKLNAGIAIFLTIDTDEDRSGDHWVALVGVNKSTGQYAFYDTYNTSIHWADIHYCGAAGATKDNAISFLRSVSYDGPSEPIVLDPPEYLMALGGYHEAIPLAWNKPPGTTLGKVSEQQTIIHERMFNPQNYIIPSHVSPVLEQGSLIIPLSDSQFLLKKQSQTRLSGAMGLQSFDVFRSTSQNGSYIKIASNIKRQYYRDESVTNDQTYYYKVKAIYDTGESDFSNIASGMASSDGYRIMSGWTTSTPNIDGVININEWNNAEMVDIHYPGHSESMTMFVMNSNSTLYLAVDDIRDQNLDDLDQFAIFFDENMDREWPASALSEEGNFWLAWDGDTGSSFSLFGPRIGVWPDHLEWPERSTPAGVSQGISISSGHVQYEGAIALNTSPFNASAGDMIGLLVFTYDKTPDTFSSFWPQQAERLKTVTPDVQYWGQAPFSFGDLQLASSAQVYPDIIVTSIEIQNAMEPNLSYKITIQNTGTGETTSEFKNRIYLSLDKTIEEIDVQIDVWNFTQILASGQSENSGDLSSTISGIPAGEYYLGVIVDGDQSIDESNENNNTFCVDSPKIIISNPSIESIVVSNTNDSGPGSLREAIDRANNNAGPDSIVFNIQSSDPGFDVVSGVWAIKPQSPLPLVTDGNLTIDGSSQTEFSSDLNLYGPEIQLDGSEAVGSPSHGLFILSGMNTVRGLIINRFHNSGILLSGPSANDNLLVDNYIGVNATADDVLPNGQYGVYIVEGARNSIGLLPPEVGSQTTVSMRKQIKNITKQNIQQTSSGGGNVIAGNVGGGIYIGGEVANENKILLNDVLSNFNHGIILKGSVRHTQIFLNTIAFNNGAGVMIDGENAIQNTMLTNSITANGLEGIVLEGGNMMLPAPTIETVTDTSVAGMASANSLVQLFVDVEDEGELILGEVSSDAIGRFSWTGLIAGNNITATATDQNGNTSPFSEPYPFSGDLIVTTTADNGQGSFRNALEQANTQSGPNRILFQIPITDNGYDLNTGVWTIQPETPFAMITDEDLIIDGHSQSGFIGIDTNSEGPEIELDGSLLTNASGLCISGSGAVIAGLVINRFDDKGIYLMGVNSGLISGCYIGTDAKGLQPLGNYMGIWLYNNVKNVIIGAADSTFAGNLISGNESSGITIQDSCSHNYIIGNTIGPDLENDAMEESNLHGIYIAEDCDSNQVLFNVIGSNRETGIYIHQNSNANFIHGNQIGTDENWLLNVGNKNGIEISHSKNNHILENVIGLNVKVGVRIYGEGAIGNSVRKNSISKNGEKGISISDGGNADLSPPTLLSVTSTQVSGTAQAGQIIELFADENDQGRIYLGSVTVDATNDFYYDHQIPLPLSHITTTATDMNGNTSAFSLPYGYGSHILVTTTADGDSGSLRDAILEATNRPGPNRILFQIPMTDNGYDANRGVWTIQPATALPWIVDDDLYLDGYSQSMFIGTDTNPEGPEIEIDGSLTNEVHGLWIRGSGVTIAGLVINHFNGSGIWVQDASDGLVTGCYLGIDARGTEPASNFNGISLFRNVRNFKIGAPDSTYTGNIISGNTNYGIDIQDSCKNNQIIGNIIGPNLTGSAMSVNNLHGLYIESSDSNYVLHNKIGFNSNLGIYVNQSDYSHIEGNEIGADETWQINMGNENNGIYIENSASCQIMKNIIGFNKSNGIHIAGPEATGNLISENAISKNEMKGIHITFGGNDGISPPTILSATTTQVAGTTGGGQTIEIFNDDDDQGQLYLGSTIADAEGNFTFILSSSLQLTNITATTTDALGNTSEFSAPYETDTEVATSNLLPDRFALYQNTPNPFNPSTFIRYTIPKSSKVTLTIYDLLGREITTLVNKTQNPGQYSVIWNGQGHPSGIYICELKAGDFTETRKLVLQK
jgi:parallel beta-helix repeat protein